VNKILEKFKEKLRIIARSSPLDSRMVSPGSSPKFLTTGFSKKKELARPGSSSLRSRAPSKMVGHKRN